MSSASDDARSRPRDEWYDVRVRIRELRDYLIEEQAKRPIKRLTGDARKAANAEIISELENALKRIDKKKRLTKKHKAMSIWPWNQVLGFATEDSNNWQAWLPARGTGRFKSKDSKPRSIKSRPFYGFQALLEVFYTKSPKVRFAPIPDFWKVYLDQVSEIIGYPQERRPWPNPPQGARTPKIERLEEIYTPGKGTRGPPLAIPDNLPERDIEFFPRYQLMEKIRKATAGPAEPLSITVLRGSGGMGKTESALHFAENSADRFCARLQVIADTEESLERSFAALAEDAVLNLQGSSHQENEERVFDWLNARHDQPWLLIFDNVDSTEAEKAILRRLRKLRNGHVLITARRAFWPKALRIGGVAVPIKVHKVEPFSDREAEKFLREKVVKFHRAARRDMLALLPHLGGIPQLLQNAVAIMNDEDVSFAELLSDWRRMRQIVLQSGLGSEINDKDRASYRKGAVRWLASVARLDDEPFRLLQMLAWLSPERIPRQLFDTDDLRKSTKQLASNSLITYVRSKNLPEERGGPLRARRTTPGGDQPAFTINSALQDTTREAHKWKDVLKDTDLERLTEGAVQQLQEVAKLIAHLYQTDEELLLPHALSVLHYLHQHDIEELDLFDRIGELIVLALGSVSTLGNTNIKHLISVLGDFYEVDPLRLTLERLASQKEVWRDIQEPMLDANNYVLRYVMGEALASQKAWATGEIEALVSADRGLNEFELGGYALTIRYAGMPSEEIKGEWFRKLAERPAYSGSSILGDFLLNLAFRPDCPEPSYLRELVGEDFWSPTWEFVELDVTAARAGMALLRRLPVTSLTGNEALELARLKALRDEIKAASTDAARLPQTRSLLDGYDRLGYDESLDFKNAEAEFKVLDEEAVRRFTRLFFAHPVWSVAEKAASLLSILVREAKDQGDTQRLGSLLRVIKDLLTDQQDWRVRYGANEAAYQIRGCATDEYAFFYQAIRQCSDQENAKIQGLCAENLVSHMLNSNRDRRNSVFDSFKGKFKLWINHDDAWVLEHVHRLFSRLERIGKPLIDLTTGEPVNPQGLIREGALAHGIEFAGSRDRFLDKIERRKRKRNAADPARQAQRLWPHAASPPSRL